MRTEEDLRALFAAREDLAPDQHRVLEGTRLVVARRRRRRAVVAAAAAAVVAVALPVTARGLWAGPGAEGPQPDRGAPAAGTASPSPEARVPSGPRPPFAFTIRPVTAAGYEIRPMAVSPDVQIAAIQAAGKPDARLTVYRAGADGRVHPGGWDADPDSEPARVTVNGAPAWYSVRDGSSTIRWEHAPGAWAVIGNGWAAKGKVAEALPRETLIALAEAVRFTAPYPAKVPYRLSYLPEGFVPFNVGQGDTDQGTPSRVVQFRDGTDQPGGMDITVLGGPASGQPGWRADRTIAGRPARCTELVDGRRCMVDFGTFAVDVGTPTTTPVATVDRIVAGMTFADWNDPATWYDIDAALPGR